MGFFNRKVVTPEKNASAQGNGNAAWDGLKNVPMAGEKAPLTPEESHRRKIINFMETGKFHDGDLDRAMENSFYEKMGNRLYVVGEESFFALEEDFLKKIKGTYESEAGLGGVAKQIDRDSMQQDLLNQVCRNLGINEESLANGGEDRLVEMLSAKTDIGLSLETPVGFEQSKRELLQDIKQSGDSELYQQAVTAMEELEKNIYGKKYEYFQALEKIRKETPYKLGWAVLLDAPDPYDSMITVTREQLKREGREASPEYQQAYNKGVEVAQQLKALIEQNPEYADAIKAGYESILR